MPLGPGVRYRVRQTSKGPQRLAFAKSGKVLEVKNMKTGQIKSLSDRAKEKGSIGR